MAWAVRIAKVNIKSVLVLLVAALAWIVIMVLLGFLGTF
jgi:hypothetical protein